MSNPPRHLLATAAEDSPVTSVAASLSGAVHPRTSASLLPDDFWQSAFDALEEPTWLVDVDCRIQHCNRAARKLFGNDIIGCFCWQVAHYNCRKTDHCPLSNFGESLRRETADTNVNGRWFTVTLDPLLDAQGNLAGALHMMRDITEERLVEQEAQGREVELERNIIEGTRQLEAANSSLNLSEEIFHLLFSAIKDAVLVFDAETHRFVEFNDATLKIYGYTRKELENLTAMDLTAEPEASAASIARTAAGLPNPIPLRYHRKKDGTIFPVEISASTCQIGGRTMFCGVVRDITERRQVEISLRDSNARLKKVLENEAVGVMFWNLASGCLIHANDTFLKFSGYTRQQVATRELTRQKLTPPEFLEVNLAELRQLEMAGHVGPHEKECFCRDGSRRWFISAGSSLGNGMAVEFCVDISDRKKIEAELLASEERYRTLVEQSPDGIFVLDGQTRRILDFNAASAGMFGLSLHEAVNLEITDLTIPEDIPRLSTEIARLVSGETLVTEWVAQRKDGSQFHCEIRAQQLPDGRIQGFIRDISERKQAEEDLRESEQRYRTLFEHANEGIIILSDDGQLISVNRAFANMHGYSREELLAMHWQDFDGDESASLHIERIGRLKRGESLVFEAEHLHRDGYRFQVEVSASLISFGGESFILALHRDIAERKQAEQRIARFRRVKDILSGVDHAIVHIKNQQRLLNECCRVAVEKGGFRLAWIGIVTPSGTVQPVAQAGETGFLKSFHAVIQDVPEGQGAVGTCIRENRPVVIDDVYSDPRMKPWHDQALQFELPYLAAFPIRIADRVVGSFQVYTTRANFFDEEELELLNQISDEISYGMTAIHLATQKRKAEAALRKSEKELLDFFSSSPVGLLWVGPDGRIVKVNKAELKLLGHDEESVLGQPVGMFHADPDAVGMLLDRVSRRETVHNHHTRLKQKNGGIVHVLIDANGLWEKQRLVCSRWFVRDISRRVELEREVLMTAEQERQRLGQDLHDDLCQQLTGIHFLSEVLATNLKNVPGTLALDAREISRLARTAAEQARDMAHGLSPFQLDEEGLMEALHALAIRTSKVFRRECRFECPMPVLIPDETVSLHLLRIAQEAISNAIKHGKAGRIDIKLKSLGHNVILAIKDNGMGLPEKPVAARGMGLRVMQYRAGLVGGSLVVQHRAKGGTEVICTVHDGLTSQSQPKAGIHENQHRSSDGE